MLEIGEALGAIISDVDDASATLHVGFSWERRNIIEVVVGGDLAKLSAVLQWFARVANRSSVEQSPRLFHVGRIFGGGRENHHRF